MFNLSADEISAFDNKELLAELIRTERKYRDNRWRDACKGAEYKRQLDALKTEILRRMN